MAGWLSRNARKQEPMVADAIEYMDERFPFWLTKVLNIGQPVMDPNVAAAAIEYDKTTGDFSFRMNPEFAATLTDAERAFLMSHEAMHVVRNDMRTHADPAYPDKDALNQAMDAIINDTLTNNGLEAPEWAVSGPRDVGFDCEDADLEEVYETIVQNKPPQSSNGDGDQNEDESGESDDEQEEEDGDTEQADDDAEPTENDDEPDESEGDGDADEQGEESEDEGDEAEDETDPTESEDEGKGGDGGQADTDNAGDDADGQPDNGGQDDQGNAKPMAGGGHEGWGDQDMEDAADEHGEGGQPDPMPSGDARGKRNDEVPGIVQIKDLHRIDYDEMLKLVEPELVDGFGMGHPARADWSRPRRSTMSLYPHTNLPSRRDDQRKLALASKRMQLVVFIDNSGSISPEDIAIFRKLASRLPKAKADYLFVAASSYAIEVKAEDLFDETKPPPNVGDANSSHYSRQILSGYQPKDSDAYKTSQMVWTPEFQSAHCGGYSTGGVTGGWEFDSMQAWIRVALQDGRLRSYPKSVMVITDAESYLTTATQEEANVWQVFVNRAKESMGLRRELYQRRCGCKIPQENVHRLGDFLLNESHVVKRQRV